MFNKYQRDQQVKRVTEMQKQRLVSGYLNDDKYEISPQVQRILNSPRRAGPAGSTGASPTPADRSVINASQLSKPPQVSTANLADVTDELGMGSGLVGDEDLTSKAERVIEARSRKNNDLANRSR